MDSKRKKALLLISGGFDSPVAGKIAQKEFNIQAIHFSQEPFTDNAPELKAGALCKKLGLKEMNVAKAGQEFKTIAEECSREYYFVLIKIFMLRVSERFAEQNKIKFLITGESLGQVSSQTLSNLNTLNNSVKIQVLRPVLFLEKQEIIDKSIEDGFFETAKGPEMCDALASGSPKTKTKAWYVEGELKKCKMNELIENTINKIVKIKL